ncbi:MAG TPA: lysylphosphatidylglycerol synthase transmembrane domain-containing protein [Desulfatiglandales bacterium]|nr:lysylphosphatidylglycerol synthase transmembrane domain-containing protein [Desulfatiglandales bacterium]
MNQVRYPNRSINWKLWIGLLISAVFLYLSFKKVDIYRTWVLIRTSDLRLIALVVIITFIQFVIRSWRWHIFLETLKKTGFTNRLLSVLIGFAANCILPARLGEFVRANYLGYTEKISRVSAFGTIVVERIFDGFILLLILLIGLLGTPFTEESSAVFSGLRVTGLSVFLIYTLLILFLLGFKYRTDTFITILERLLFPVSQTLRSRIIPVVRNFAAGLVPIKDVHGWAMAIFYSLLLWFSALYQVKMIACSIGLSIPFIATFLVIAMAAFGVMIPSSPGYIGTYHLAVQYGFLLFGAAREEALSAAILLHATFFFPTILFGAVAFAWLKIRRGGISRDSLAPGKE